MNAIDVVQDIKQSVPLPFIYSSFIPVHSLKFNMLGCIFINILTRV